MPIDEKLKKKLDELAQRVREQQMPADTFRQNVSLESRIPALGGTLPAETTKKQSPGLLSRIFDVISRPLYAVAETARRGVEDGFQFSDLAGMGAGITGKAKTSFSDVLEEAGVENKWVKGIGGFIGDVIFDPTTYLGAGIAKKIGKETLGKVAGESLEKVAGKGAARLTGKEVVEEAMKKADALGLAAKGPERGKFVGKLVREAEDSARYKKVIESVRDAASKSPGRVQLRFMGKPIGKGSEKLYNLGGLVSAKALDKSKTLRTLNKAFRPAALMPDEIRAVKQAVEGRGFISYERDLKEVQRQFRKISKEDRKKVSHAIEKGAVDTLEPHLKPLAEFAQGEFEKMWNMEKALGVVGPDIEKLDNYIYHVFDDSEVDRLQAIKKKAVGTERPGFGKARAFKNLDEAKEHGLKPIEEIDQILAHRMAKHYQATNRNLFVDEIVQRFGIKPTTKDARRLAKKGLLKESTSKYVPQGVYFDKEVKDAMDLVETLTVRSPENRHLLKMFDKIQNKYKFLLTAPNPGFHVRNLMGDAFNNFLDGVVSVRPYTKSMAILTKKKTTVRVGKLNIKGDDIDQLFTFRGLKTGFIHAETGAGGGRGPFAAAGRGLRKGSEYREDFARMAHFIDALKKEGKNITSTKQLEAAAERAAARVRKFNFDYTDLTRFEQNAMRRAVPFYTWLRKNIPLQMEMAATRPGRVAVVPKGMKAIGEVFGGDPNEDPFPGLSNIVPQWLRDMAGVRVRGEKGGQNALFFAPQLPIQDITKFTEDFARGDVAGALRNALAISSPVLRTPVEVASGKRLFSGGPIGSLPEYFQEQLPLGRVASSLQGGGASPFQTLVNYIGGAGLYEVTPQGRQGELKRMQDPLTLILAQLRARDMRLGQKEDIPLNVPLYEKFKYRGG